MHERSVGIDEEPAIEYNSHIYPVSSKFKFPGSLSKQGYWDGVCPFLFFICMAFRLVIYLYGYGRTLFIFSVRCMHGMLVAVGFGGCMDLGDSVERLGRLTRGDGLY